MTWSSVAEMLYLAQKHLLYRAKEGRLPVWNFGKSRCRTSSASRRRRSARMCRRFCFLYRTFFQDQILDILRIFGLTSVILPPFCNSLFTNVSWFCASLLLLFGHSYVTIQIVLLSAFVQIPLRKGVLPPWIIPIRIPCFYRLPMPLWIFLCWHIVR